jgi:hypothetical protein
MIAVNIAALLAPSSEGYGVDGVTGATGVTDAPTVSRGAEMPHIPAVTPGDVPPCNRCNGTIERPEPYERFRAFLDLWDERAAIMEDDGGLSRSDAEQLAWTCLLETLGKRDTDDTC